MMTESTAQALLPESAVDAGYEYPFQDTYEEAALYIEDALYNRDSSRTLNTPFSVWLYRTYHGRAITVLQYLFTTLFLLIAFFERPTWCFTVGPNQGCTTPDGHVNVPVSGLPLLPQLTTQVSRARVW